MKLPLVNVFEKPYVRSDKRVPTNEEMESHLEKTGKSLPFASENSKKIAENHIEAARHILQKSTDNALEMHVTGHLQESPEFKEMLTKMPSDAPESIENYKQNYPDIDTEKVSSDIKKFGLVPSEGQYVFHGGFLDAEEGQEVETNRPLSTSFCPQVAIRNAEWRDKAYNKGQIHLLVIKVTEPKTKAYVFPLSGDLGNEKEILFETNAKLKIKSKKLIRENYIAYSMEGKKKEIPAYLIEADLS